MPIQGAMGHSPTRADGPAECRHHIGLRDHADQAFTFTNDGNVMMTRASKQGNQIHEVALHGPT